MVSFEAEVASHFDYLVRYCKRFEAPGMPFDAEDLAQNAILKAIEKKESYTPGNLRAWVVRIAHNYALNVLNRERRIRRQRDEYKETYIETAHEDETDWAPMTDFLIECIGELTRDYQVIVFLIDVQGKKYCEASEELGIPMGTVMSRIHRARKMLKAKAEAKTDSPASDEATEGD